MEGTRKCVWVRIRTVPRAIIITNKVVGDLWPINDY